MKSPLITSIMGAISKSSRSLYRDYFELEQQQSSKRPMDDFVQRSYNKCEETIKTELAKYSTIEFDILAIDGMANLKSAIPLFGTVVCAYQVDKEARTAIASVIEFPALGETYMAEKGAGAWMERYIHNSGNKPSMRLRVSGRKDCSLALCDEQTTVPSPYRILGCSAYSICLLASGKADIASFSEDSPALVSAAKLFIQEAGGQIVSDNPLILSNGCCSL